MAVETATDRLILLSDFGIDAEYTHNGSTSNLKGILDKEYEAVDAGGGVPFAMEQPRFHIRTQDAPNATDGDTLVIEGVTYAVRVVMPDGQGMTELQLENQDEY
jgi:hypothetical protein